MNIGSWNINELIEAEKDTNKLSSELKFMKPISLTLKNNILPENNKMYIL